MAYIVNNKHIKQVSVLTEPNSYQTDIKPEDMQSGSTAVSKGKIVVGTGRAFEFASYGREFVDIVLDENGNERFGIVIPEPLRSNLLFLSSTSDGDCIVQEKYLIDSDEELVIKVGTNRDTLSDIRVYYADGYLCIYSMELANSNTRFNYFEGKDNLI